jgi:hypothetical protein
MRYEVKTPSILSKAHGPLPPTGWPVEMHHHLRYERLSIRGYVFVTEPSGAGRRPLDGSPPVGLPAGHPRELRAELS